jgi:hypothetical protein
VRYFEAPRDGRRPRLIEKWFEEGALGTWEHDRETHELLKLLVTCAESRPRDFPETDESTYQADLANYGSP